jgi:hypothetical protein
MENIRCLEDRILRVAFDHLPDNSSFPPQGSAGHNTAKVDFEYHAFVLAAQRALEYLALAAQAFFQVDKAGGGSKIKALARTIKEAEPVDVRDHVLKRLDKARATIPGFIAHGIPTARDIISQVKNIEPAYLHVMYNAAGWQILLTGGALSERSSEDLTMHTSSVSALLRDDLQVVKKLILGTYWDFGLLHFPRTGGTSVNAELAQI